MYGIRTDAVLVWYSLQEGLVKTSRFKIAIARTLSRREKELLRQGTASSKETGVLNLRPVLDHRKRQRRLEEAYRKPQEKKRG